jgi:hypothetical protein
MRLEPILVILGYKNRLLAEIDFWLYLAYFRENRRKWRKPRD